MKNYLLVLILLSATGLVACNNVGFSKVANQNPGNKEQAVPECEIDPVIYQLTTNIYDFEITGSNGLHFGFNLGGIIKLLDTNFSMQSGRMQAHMTITDSLSQNTLADVNGIGPWKSNGFSTSIDFGKYGVGFNYTKSTPIGQMTLAGLQDGVTHAAQTLSGLNIPWQTRVVKVTPDGTVLLNVGATAGLKAGDQFAIYNVVNEWFGTPCSSPVISRKTSNTPIAVATIQDMSDLSPDGSSVALTVNSIPTEAIKPGALVFVSSLVGKNRHLNLPIRVNPVVSESLQLVNGQDVDLSSYAEQQISSVVTAHGFYIHK
jgi:hypothetical protein